MSLDRRAFSLHERGDRVIAQVKFRVKLPSELLHGHSHEVLGIILHEPVVIENAVKVTLHASSHQLSIHMCGVPIDFILDEGRLQDLDYLTFKLVANVDPGQWLGCVD